MKTANAIPPIADESFRHIQYLLFSGSTFLADSVSWNGWNVAVGCSLFNASASGLFHSLPSGAVASEVCKSA